MLWEKCISNTIYKHICQHFINNEKHGIDTEHFYALFYRVASQKNGLRKSADEYKNRKEKVFEFEQKPIKLESPPHILREKNKKMSKLKQSFLRNTLLSDMENKMLEKLMDHVKRKK